MFSSEILFETLVRSMKIFPQHLLDLLHLLEDTMAAPQYQNTILFNVDLTNGVNFQRQTNNSMLLGQFNLLAQENQHQLNTYFQLTIRRIVTGYAFYRNALEISGRRTFKPAMRRNPEFQALDEDRKEEICRDIECIKKIHETWDNIVQNCTMPHMTNIDVRNFPLWKLARCHSYEFVEKENNRVNTRSRPTARTYHLYMVDDIVNNVAGSTDLILNEVNRDTEQINLIAKDFHRVLLRRANNLP